MSISNNEFQRRYKALREMMKQEKVDCLLVVGLADDFNRGNIRYITGSGRGGCCILPPGGAPVVPIAPGQSSSPKLRKTMAALDLLEVRETADITAQSIKELARLDNGKNIGIVGAGCVSVSLHEALNDAFKHRLIDCTWMFENLRSVKSDEEIENTRTAASIADSVYYMLREMLHPALDEFAIYGAVKRVIYERGCEYSFELIDAAGATMDMSFFPTSDKLEENGTLFIEITPAYDGYYCQLPLTLPVTGYSPLVKDMLSAWAEADMTVREILRPGTKVSDLYHLLINEVKKKGFISPYRPGHSIGLDALDFWSITDSNEIVLQPGMVLAVHPSVMKEVGGDACGMGYTYLITGTGAEKLSKIDLAEELL
jgi:Xaa-Pro aminopeptidase